MSPFCVKVQMALALKGVSFETVSTLFAKRHNPRGKLPYLLWDGEPVEDSTAIVQTIEQRSEQGPALIPADPRLAADAHLLEDWADESLYWFGVYAKFYDEEGWRHMRPALAALVPAPLRPVLPSLARRSISQKLRAQGLLTRSPELIASEFEHHLEALSARLERGPYLVGDAICMADVAVVSMLWQLTVGATPQFGRRIDKHPALVDYIKHVREECQVGGSA